MYYLSLVSAHVGCPSRTAVRCCLMMLVYCIVRQIKIGTKAEAADGINRTALREIKLLQELSHPNVIGVS